jgi:hypothetical protein
VKATVRAVEDGELARLEHLRDLLAPDKVTGQVKLLLFARSGFTCELRRSSADRGDVELIDLGRVTTATETLTPIRLRLAVMGRNTGHGTLVPAVRVLRGRCNSEPAVTVRDPAEAIGRLIR